ncbi:MAG: flagellar hook-associated protein FlgK [Alphaproteobacteria bacterium]|jgi:flagellar hook-associated protein FlgK|nr:flagellar hook-associated protein FlgK [Alphaproteobacteria bacterium]
MTLTAALMNSLSGLRSAQTGMDVISRNVANAGTEGYTRKTAAQESVVLQGQGAGVRRLAIEREIDLRVQRELRVESAANEKLSVIDEFRQRVDAMFGRPEEEQSFASAVNRLTRSFQTLADKPESATLRRDVVDTAAALAGDLNRLSDRIQDMRLEADQGMVDGVRTINDALHNIKELNQKIGVRAQSGRSYADLADQRDHYLDKISSLMDVSYFERGSGEVVIMTGSGRPMLDVNVRELRIDGRSVITPQSLYSDDPSARGVSTISLVTEGGEVDLLANNEIRGGKLAGLIEIRDRALPELQSQLDEFAHQLATTLSVGEVTASPVTSVTSTQAGAFAGLDFDLFGSGSTDATLDLTIDGTTVQIPNFAIDNTDADSIAASIQQALDGSTAFAPGEITVSASGSDALTGALTFTDSQGRKIDGVTFTDNTAPPPNTAAPALDPSTASTTLDISSVATAGDTVSVNYAITGSSETRTVTLTAVDPPGNGEPGTFVLGQSQATTYGNIESALQSALDDVVLPAGTLTVSRTGSEITITDSDLSASTQELRGFSAATRGAADLQLTLFGDNGGDAQIAYTGRQPGETTDQRVGFAQRIAVSEALRDDPSALVRYMLDPATGELAPGGDSARPAEMVRRLSEMTLSFDSAVGMGPVETTIEGFAIEIISFQATQTAQTSDRLAYQQEITDNVARRFDSVSGVNIDDEMTELLLLERTYAASSQVLSAVQRMMDELLDAVR